MTVASNESPWRALSEIVGSLVIALAPTVSDIEKAQVGRKGASSAEK
jgi:hypothetical protein